MPPATPITRLIAFGDSLTDTGNLRALTGQPAAPYFEGRFCDGPVWVEYLADLLGVPRPTPASLHPAGTDYTWGGSTCHGSPCGVSSLVDQVSAFRSRDNLGPGDLVALWAGANDIYFLFQDENFIANATGAIRAALRSLVEAGGRRFLVLNVPLLGHTPIFRGTHAEPIVNGLTERFNQALDGALAEFLGPDVRLHRLDVRALFEQIRARPSAFGFTDVTGQGIKAPGTSGFLFWDTAHPTTQAHRLLAQHAYEALRRPSARRSARIDERKGGW